MHRSRGRHWCSEREPLGWLALHQFSTRSEVTGNGLGFLRWVSWQSLGAQGKDKVLLRWEGATQSSTSEGPRTRVKLGASRPVCRHPGSPHKVENTELVLFLVTLQDGVLLPNKIDLSSQL